MEHACKHEADIATTATTLKYVLEEIREVATVQDKMFKILNGNGEGVGLVTQVALSRAEINTVKKAINSINKKNSPNKKHWAYGLFGTAGVGGVIYAVIELLEIMKG